MRPRQYGSGLKTLAPSRFSELQYRHSIGQMCFPITPLGSLLGTRNNVGSQQHTHSSVSQGEMAASGRSLPPNPVSNRPLPSKPMKTSKRTPIFRECSLSTNSGRLGPGMDPEIRDRRSAENRHFLATDKRHRVTSAKMLPCSLWVDGATGRSTSRSSLSKSMSKCYNSGFERLAGIHAEK